MLGPPITQVMRANAGAAVPNRSSSMASKERPWERSKRIRCIGGKDTQLVLSVFGQVRNHAWEADHGWA